MIEPQSSPPASAAPPQQIAVAVVCHDGRYLVGQRANQLTLGGHAEFPGGKVRPGEAAAAAAVRECREETGLEVEVTGRFDPILHTYLHGTLELHFFRCRLAGDGRPREPFRWVEPAELAGLEFPAANRPILAEILGVTPKNDARPPASQPDA